MARRKKPLPAEFVGCDGRTWRPERIDTAQHQCSSHWKYGDLCPLAAMNRVDGEWFCNVHNPNGELMKRRKESPRTLFKW